MKKRQSLKSPAVAMAMANPKLVEKAAKTTMILSVAVIGGVSLMAFYHLYWKNRFKSVAFDKTASPSNISKDIARLKAETIYKAIYGAGANFEAVRQALSGVNKNGLIAIYNAFGKRKPATSIGFSSKNDMDLFTWLKDQFDENKIDQLRMLTSSTGLW